MAKADRYQVDIARDDPRNLMDVLQNIATREDHIQIVSVVWRRPTPDGEGYIGDPGYTIISEKQV